MSEIILNEKQVAICNEIGINLNQARDSDRTKEDKINLASDLLYKLLGNTLTPDYDLFKQAQAFITQLLISKYKFIATTADNYFSEIVKTLTAKHQGFKKPAKNTKDSARMSEKRQAIEKEFKHVAIESINNEILSIATDNSKQAQARLSILNQAKKAKLAKIESDKNNTQKDAISKYVDEITLKMKDKIGVDKNGKERYAYSLNKLEFVSFCLNHESEIRKAIKALKS